MPVLKTEFDMERDNDSDFQADQHLIDEKPNVGGGHHGGGGGLVCSICGDRATGRHYGSIACNGCKGFFRRTIRRAYKYTCRFNGSCQIDKHNRAVCRACRYMRCIKNGMKVDAVQNERDLIGKRPRTQSASAAVYSSPPPPSVSSPPATAAANGMGRTQNTFFAAGRQSSFGADSASMDSSSPQGSRTDLAGANNNNNNNASGDPWDSPSGLLEFLLKAEEKIKTLRDTVIQETAKVDYSIKREPCQPIGNGRKANVNDIMLSLHSQLLLVIEWAKTLKPFAELSTEDQTALLKNFASQHIVLCVAYRSINAPEFLKLINDSCIPRADVDGSHDENDYLYRKDCERVMDTLVAPMRFMQLDDVEFVALKACILFNPVARGLSNESIMKVLETRRKIFASLQSYVDNKIPRDANRIGDLTFFILSPLQSLAKSISEDVLVAKLSGVARIDMLMEELILEDNDPKESAADMRRSFSETDDRNQRPPPTSPVTSRLVSVSPSSAPVNSTMNFAAANGGTRPTSSSLSAGSLAASTNGPTIVTPTASNVQLNGGGAQYGSTAMRSPIRESEMSSTLSSYVFGNPLQGPLSPSNDVFLSASSVSSQQQDVKPTFANLLQANGGLSPTPSWQTPSMSSGMNGGMDVGNGAMPVGSPLSQFNLFSPCSTKF
ncbi:Protein NHR-35 b [Aphelenchoides avenae]|nr:Protein NHR-35 b [Aphelenchus avenae]